MVGAPVFSLDTTKQGTRFTNPRDYFIKLRPRHYTFGKINPCEELFYPSQRSGEDSNLVVKA